MSKRFATKRYSKHQLFVILASLSLAILCQVNAVRAAPPPDVVAREHMVSVVEAEVRLLSGETGIEAIDVRVLDAMRVVPRHDFVPEELKAYSYNNHPLPIGHGQNLAAPLLIALMTHLAELTPDDVVFETGTGAGYHAAVLARLVARVYSVEVIEPLAEQAAKMLKHRGDVNVEVHLGDGYEGWPEHAPYDAMIIKESLDHVPPALVRQLKPGGRLILPLGPADGAQDLTVIRRTADGRLIQKTIIPVRFSPMQGGDRL
jgi:protein-L-isoaspartate(D-aspartate) O-methyltransferase